MSERKKWTHLAGFCYLIVVISGIICLGYIPNQLIDWQSPEITYQNISKNLGLFRIGVFASIICYLAYTVLPLILYKILSPIHKNLSIMMVVLVIVSIPITFYNLANKLDIINLFTKPQITKLFDESQKIERTFLLLRTYENGLTMASLFWGLWLFPFGLLVVKSGFLPKLLGVLLVMGCFGYCINIFGNLLVPNYNSLGISNYVSIPASVGEIGTCLWLLIMGDKKGFRS